MLYFTIMLNFTNLHFLSVRIYNVTNEQLVLRNSKNCCCSSRIPFFYKRPYG